jgi:tetratricopeptide (TPR) repeat protein
MPLFHKKYGSANREKTQQTSRISYIRPGGALDRQEYSQIVILAILLLIVAVCVTLTHWPALSAQVSSFDDSQYLHKNRLVQNPSWTSTWRFLSEILHPSTVGGYYQPLAMISLMLDYAMGGRSDNLLPFHITSLCLHVVNTSLVIVLLYILFGKVWPAAIVGLLFGLHPMTVEPIPWVSERKTLLASFFALWSMIIYVHYARKSNRKLLTGCAVMYVLALMSKPTTTPLPVLLLLLDFWPLRRLNKQALMEKVPLFVIMVIFAFITVISQSRAARVMMPGEYGHTQIPLILCHNIVFYLYKIIWPVNLSSYYPFPVPLDILDTMTFAGVVGTCILLPTLLLSLRWTRALLTGWLFFFIAIFPTMGIIGFTSVIASDRYAYLPSAGLLMVLAWLFGRLWPYVSGSLVRRIIIVLFILLLAVSESIATRRYLVYWQDSEKIHRYMLHLAPNAPTVHLNLANTILKMQRYDEAIAHYKKAIDGYSDFVDAHYYLGLALGLEKRYDEAIEQYYTVLRLKPKHWRAQFRLANAFVGKGQLDKAIEHYNKTLQLKPNEAEVYNNLALALVKKGKINEAIEYYNKSLEINRDSAEVLNNLGNALVKQKKLSQAVIHFEKALALKPDFAEAHYNFANALKMQNRFHEAVKHYDGALKLDPNDADAHYSLGLTLAELRKYDEAVDCYRAAIQLRPDFAKAYYNLGIALFNQGELDQAIEQFRQVLRIHPKDAEMHCNLGVLLAQKGRTDEAIEEFRAALRFDPDLSRAREQLQVALAKKADLNSQ